MLASGEQAAGRMASSTSKKHREKGNSVIEIPHNSSAPGLPLAEAIRVNRRICWVCSKVNM